MIPFQTTSSQLETLPSITKQLEEIGINSKYIDLATHLAQEDQGIYDLLVLLVDRSNPERLETLADLIRSIEYYQVERCDCKRILVPVCPECDLRKHLSEKNKIIAQMRTLLQRVVAKPAGLEKELVAQIKNFLKNNVSYKPAVEICEYSLELFLRLKISELEDKIKELQNNQPI